MEKKNILICLEKLGIGGVETAVLNQAITFIGKGYNVIILAKKGIYTKILEEKGAICIDFEFMLNDNFNEDKTKEIISIIEKYKIQEMHIHQFPCILSAFPACIIKNIPYIAYAHNGVAGVYEWFMTEFSVYKIAIPYYYQYANKIIAITEDVKKDIMQRFEISEDKIMIINNSISFEESDKILEDKENRLNNFLIISRFEKEKLQSIYNGIDLFTLYEQQNKNAFLSIAGDGDLKQEVENYIINKGIQDKVSFIGATNNVLEQINKVEIVLGLGRCILEAISMKKIAIIMGYDEPKQLITPENIEVACKNNFSGRGIESKKIEDLTKQLKQLSADRIKEIVQGNYDYAKEHLDIKNNVYTIDNVNVENNIYIEEILKMLLQEQKKINEEIIKNEELEKKLEDEIKKNKIEQEKNLKKDERINALEREISSMYKSKRWRYAEKISKILHRKK